MPAVTRRSRVQVNNHDWPDQVAALLDRGSSVSEMCQGQMAPLHFAAAYNRTATVRVLLERVPCELVRHFEPRFPLIVGGLQPGEETLGVTLCRLKKHRWHKRVLKSSDALVFSVGWRRFQSLPLYCTKDANLRLRHIKYTPEHMHCGAHFKGYGVAPNTPLLGFHSLKQDCATFRVCLVGVVVKQETLSPVVKKLKLCGAPYGAVWKSTSESGAPDNSSRSPFSARTRPC